jgi:hypothetical protein
MSKSNKMMETPESKSSRASGLNFERPGWGGGGGAARSGVARWAETRSRVGLVGLAGVSSWPG